MVDKISIGEGTWLTPSGEALIVKEQGLLLRLPWHVLAEGDGSVVVSMPRPGLIAADVALRKPPTVRGLVPEQVLHEEVAEHTITMDAYDASRAKCADLQATIDRQARTILQHTLGAGARIKDMGATIDRLTTEIRRQTERGDRWCEAHSRLSERIEAIKAALP